MPIQAVPTLPQAAHFPPANRLSLSSLSSAADGITAPEGVSAALPACVTIPSSPRLPPPPLSSPRAAPPACPPSAPSLPSLPPTATAAATGPRKGAASRCGGMAISYAPPAASVGPPGCTRAAGEGEAPPPPPPPVLTGPPAAGMPPGRAAGRVLGCGDKALRPRRPPPTLK